MKIIYVNCVFFRNEYECDLHTNEHHLSCSENKANNISTTHNLFFTLSSKAWNLYNFTKCMPLHCNLVLPFTSQTQGGGAGELSKGSLLFLSLERPIF